MNGNGRCGKSGRHSLDEINYNPESPIGTLMSVERSLHGFETVQTRLEAEIPRDE
jgi:hypothetical protein